MPLSISQHADVLDLRVAARGCSPVTQASTQSRQPMHMRDVQRVAEHHARNRRRVLARDVDAVLALAPALDAAEAPPRPPPGSCAGSGPGRSLPSASCRVLPPQAARAGPAPAAATAPRRPPSEPLQEAATVAGRMPRLASAALIALGLHSRLGRWRSHTGGAARGTRFIGASPARIGGGVLGSRGLITGSCGSWQCVQLIEHALALPVVHALAVAAERPVLAAGWHGTARR